jgi:hypothetical protein
MKSLITLISGMLIMAAVVMIFLAGGYAGYNLSVRTQTYHVDSPYEYYKFQFKDSKGVWQPWVTINQDGIKLERYLKGSWKGDKDLRMQYKESTGAIGYMPLAIQIKDRRS